ncbi:hypothetical protein [Micromonospora sediminicola]|uniref:hypothetical protein n=1 Tax=Micromonospora sediminicola TaxID=946078 RepID=UPI0037A3F807
MIAVVLVLHALQCATGLDAPRSSADPATVAVPHTITKAGAGGTSVALLDDATVPVPVLVHGHHRPADGGEVAVTACLILLVAAGAVLLGVLRGWILRVVADRGLRSRVRSRLVGGFSLSQLCVLRT